MPAIISFDGGPRFVVAIGHHRGHDEACPSIIQSKLLEMCEIHSSKHFVDTTLARDPSEGVPRVALGKPT
ncbi:MAG: hypothetical protein ACOYMV_12210, partial [Verrucomicrobiia bacterium]